MKKLLFFSVLLGFPMSAFAEDLNAADTAWILTSTALVLFMIIPGLSLFYAGLVRSANVLSILMQCFAITCIVSLLWLFFGYSLAFSDGGDWNAWIGGLGNAGLSEVTRGGLTGTIPESLFVMFQMTFAIITVALITGGFAERMKFSAVVLFSVLWAIFVYFPVCHWVWGGGWLAQMGLLDSAGGVVVHITAGVAALVAALMLGNREGFQKPIVLPHNLTMTVTGAGMLWVGWFGFNGGSALAANGDASMAILVTHISAATAALTWVAIEWIKYGKPSVLGIVTGMVAGLGTITPASGFVGPMGALAIGVCAGILCFAATSFLKQRLKIDDALDVFPVHAVGGMLGTLLVAVFISESWGGSGIVAGMTIGSQLTVQIIGIVSVFAWTAVVTFAILKLVSVLTGLRISPQEEREGIDVNEHNEKGYNLSA